MTLIERPTFESEENKEVYQHVERQGAASVEELRNSLGLSDDRFREAIEQLESKGYVERRDGHLELGLDVGTEEDHETRDLTYTIRPARETDLDSLVDTIERVTSKDTYAVGETLADELRYEDTVVRHNSVWSRVFFVATVDEHVVGWSHLDLPQTETLRNTAQLTVGVRDDYRGYGIGARLLEKALDWAEANGYHKVYNSVASTNANAITFLQSQGWTKEAVHEEHFTIGDQQVDEVMLSFTF